MSETMNLVYFIILISSLVFVHELGHFMFAKVFGVKVLTFSLGFGPKILRWRGSETEYCVGLLPLGGYVRMLGASTAIVMPEDRLRTFESLSLYKRIIIVLAGPMMNMIFPVFLYFSVFIDDGPFLPPTVGIVLPGHPAEGQLFPGDRVMEVAGKPIGTFDELKRIVAKHPAQPVLFKVFRDNRHVEVEVVAEETIDRRRLDIERVGTVGIQSSAPAAVIGVPYPDSPAYRAGLRTFDVITHVAGAPVRRFIDLDAELARNHGETIPITYLRPQLVDDALGGLAEIGVYESGVVALTPEAKGETLLARTGMELADLYVAVLPESSPLYEAGVRSGDKILRLDSRDVPAWSAFQEGVLAPTEQGHQIDYLKNGEVRTATFRSPVAWRLSAKHWVPLAPEQSVEHPTPVRYALSKAVDETVNVTRFVLSGMYKLLQGRLRIEDVSGPLTIYEVAGREGRKGADFFIWVLALMSINLGLLNLLPIPVLDGGHLMFFGLEALMRRPLPMRVREVAHLVGLALIFFVMAVAFKNDITRRPWGDRNVFTDWAEPHTE